MSIKRARNCFETWKDMDSASTLIKEQDKWIEDAVSYLKQFCKVAINDGGVADVDGLEKFIKEATK